MAYRHDDYKPNAKSREILARAWEHIESVEYRVSTRWLFYRMLQDGHYAGKSDYQKFIALTSRARHNNWQGWRPNTLSDDTRQSIAHRDGYRDAQEWALSLVEYGTIPTLDHWVPPRDTTSSAGSRPRRCALSSSTDTRGVTLRPFKGAPSIDYKWRIAKQLEGHAREYNLPITILYFGDDDPKGHEIPETAIADIREWCAVPFEFVRVGLNAGDGERLGLPQNFEKPGTYQWEAVPDDAARRMITGVVQRYVDESVISILADEARKAGAALLEYMQDFKI